MPLLITAPLAAEPHDLRRIEAIRRRWDPQAGLIGAHVTLVFGFETPDAATAAAHAEAVAARAGAIALRLSAVLAVRDDTAERSHVFLVPDQGRAEIEALHDSLYAGPLAAGLRRDIAYIPHVTVGGFDHHDLAEDAAREIGRIGMAGRLSRLELIDFDGAAAKVLARFELPG